ncbi:MAG TPA: hypothetical protein VK498_11720 [Ferruginibacter sp.]|nr:hypothetical protein [Ferruginibacter sp.]
MPQSKKRHHHHQHYNPPHTIPDKKSKKVAPLTVIFFALLGMGIAFFGAGINIVWLLIGAICGGGLGYFFATQLDKTVTKNK